MPRDVVTLGAKRARDAALDAAARLELDPSRADIVRSGAAAAPLFGAFALWCLEEAGRVGAEHLFFFAREGDFFLRVYEQVRAAYSGALDGPPATLLDVSRRATFAPSLTDLRVEHFIDHWSLYRPQSPRGFLLSLGLDHVISADDLCRYGLTLDQAIAEPATDIRVRALLSDARFTAPAMAEITAARARLTAYLAGKGLDGHHGCVATVDIGWRGSIQSNLARLFPKTRFHGLYLGLERRSAASALPNASKQGYVVDLDRAPEFDDLVTTVAPLEFLCNARYASTIAYCAGPDPQPVRSTLDEQTAQAFDDVVAPFQAGAVAGAAAWALHMRRSRHGAADARAAAAAAWRDIIERPSDAICRAFADTIRDETFGFGTLQRLPRRIAPPASHLAARPKAMADYMRDTVRAVPWPQAFARYGEGRGLLDRAVPGLVKATRGGRRLGQLLRAALKGPTKR